MWLIPVAYVAGIEGFGWFVPYLLFLCVVATIVRMKRQRSLSISAAMPVELHDSLLELEPAAV